MVKLSFHSLWFWPSFASLHLFPFSATQPLSRVHLWVFSFFFLKLTISFWFSQPRRIGSTHRNISESEPVKPMVLFLMLYFRHPKQHRRVTAFTHYRRGEWPSSSPEVALGLQIVPKTPKLLRRFCQTQGRGSKCDKAMRGVVWNDTETKCPG